MKGILIAILGLLLAGCVSQDVQLYPVDGPLSTQTPLPILKAKAVGVEGNSGPMSLVTQRGETCHGTWSSVAPRFQTVSSGSLFNTYGGAVFGTGVTTGNLPGVNKGQAFVSCPGGTIFDVEFYTGSGTASGYGIAKDNQGNVYKMLF